MQKFPRGACPQTPLEIVCLRTWKMSLPPLDLILAHCPPLGNFLNEGLQMSSPDGFKYTSRGMRVRSILNFWQYYKHDDCTLVVVG